MHSGGGGASMNLSMIVLLLLHLIPGSVLGGNDEVSSFARSGLAAMKSFASPSPGPSVPDTACHTQGDCLTMGWMEPLPECENSTCTCPVGTCSVYTTASEDFEYQYFCGPCGMLGSECSTSSDCQVDWQCRGDFCRCEQGTVYQGVCVYYEAVPTSVSSVVLVLILVFIIIVQQVISSRKILRKLRCRSSSESEDDVSRVVASNPQSNDKTAAFTIANSEFMATDEDPDLAWALELSRRYNAADTEEPGASTWSSTTSSFPLPDPRFTRPRTAADQPGPSGWRQSTDDTGAQHRTPRSSLSSTASSRRFRHSGTGSSNSSSLALSDDVSLPTLESLRIECDVNDFQSTRV